ncbi:hypothetical protein TRFO_02028 [Tritrichomonas foetus]|uniref:Uncharacterized protein n=1 Tax=Tritrichomonas foetus TaxID=1144522 RepID=A0A1J4JCI4_9EUKA|nr:hypothetical protein TRFO_02028 [Tritrichomonas foetus]|eukprot:OHS96914.1 hypothetical protein TRFO_02028 [Tritrichomonas foetus]
MGILSPNELCTAIISLTLPSKITSKAIPKNLKSEISHLFSSKLPIRKIKKELSGEKPFEEVLKSNSFDFPLNLLILKGFKCNRDLFETENSLSSTIIFFSYLSWIVSENSSSEIGELIYDNILLILNCVKSEKSTINIASSIMYYLLLYLVSHSAELPAGAIYKMIDQVMNGSEFIAPKKYFNVVDQSAYQLTKTEKGESEYFQLLTNLVKKYSQDVPVKTLEEAVPIVCRSLSKFELQAIEYISTLSKYLSIDFVLPFISIIPLGFTVKVNFF